MIEISKEDRARATASYALMLDIHRFQRRKAGFVPGVSAVSHVEGVAEMVLAAGADWDTYLAARHHDSIEDAEEGRDTRREIREICGQNVLDIVEHVTEKGTGFGEATLPWKERKDEYIAHLAEIPLRPLLISIADKLYNLTDTKRQVREIGNLAYENFAKKEFETVAERKEATLWFYRAVTDAAQARYEVLCGQRGWSEDEHRMLKGAGVLLLDLHEVMECLEAR